jgi:hypothetical protein
MSRFTCSLLCIYWIFLFYSLFSRRLSDGCDYEKHAGRYRGCLLLLAAAAQAGIIMGGTRVIYQEGNVKPLFQ